MIEFGKTLREAREAKGYSVIQLAEVTHILPQIIENLECEDFTKIVAPIYGRGFVKLYCEHVGLDAKPLIDAFMGIYNGNRPPVIRLNETPHEEVAPPAPEEPIAEPPPATPFVPGSDDLPFTDESRPKRDYRLPGCATMAEVPRSFWRFGVLVIAAITLLALLGIGVCALYRATMTAPAESEKANPKPSTPRTPIAVPPLYID